MATKEREKEVFKLARARERKTRDLGVVRCIKDEEGKVLTENDEIRERWQRFFAKLLNGGGVRDKGSRGGECSDQRADDHIAKKEIREALKKMANGKAVGPDQIPVEVRKFMGEVGLEWLTERFNVIYRTAKMPREWRTSTVIPLYKNKGDIQVCNNFRVSNCSATL